MLHKVGCDILDGAVVAHEDSDTVGGNTTCSQLIYCLQTELHHAVFFIFYIIFIVLFLCLEESYLHISLHLFLLRNFLFYIGIGCKQLLGCFRYRFCQFVIFLLGGFYEEGIVEVDDIAV